MHKNKSEEKYIWRSGEKGDGKQVSVIQNTFDIPEIVTPSFVAKVIT